MARSWNPWQSGWSAGSDVRDWLQSIAIDQPPQPSTTAWIHRCATELLRAARLSAFGCECRLLEIEYYFHSSHHPDPFAHQAEQQSKTGYWYLHRQGGGGFKSGSFKGLDFTFGCADLGGQAAYGGILIRSILTASGEVINGSSLCVDHLLSLASNDDDRCNSVGALHERIGAAEIWSEENPLRLSFSMPPLEAQDTARPAYATARVGLTLKRVPWREAEPYLLRRYRFHDTPAEIKKGRVQTILAMAADGLDVEQIQRRTGSPRTVIQKYLDWADAAVGSPANYEGAGMKPQELCEIWGLTHSGPSTE